jgi:hypothetical protein
MIRKSTLLKIRYHASRSSMSTIIVILLTILKYFKSPNFSSFLLFSIEIAFLSQSEESSELNMIKNGYNPLWMTLPKGAFAEPGPGGDGIGSKGQLNRKVFRRFQHSRFHLSKKFIEALFFP